MPFVKDRVPIAVMVTLAALGTTVVVLHQKDDSPTMDEPFHAMASAEYAMRGTYWANLEHPPLMKLLAGTFLKAAGARPPLIPRPFVFEQTEKPSHFCYQNTISHFDFFAAARRPFPAVFFLLVITAGLAGAWRAGRLAGAFCAAFIAFEPNLVAHAGVLHTDVPAALGFLLTLTLAFAAFEKRSVWLLVATGVSFGLSLAAKFSMVLLGPLLFVLSAIDLLKRVRGQKSQTTSSGEPHRAGRFSKQHWGFPLAGFVMVSLIAASVLFSIYQICLRQMPGEEREAAVRFFLSSRGAEPREIERAVSIGRILPSAGHYVAGLTGIAVQNRKGGGVNYLMGETSVEGFWYYFFVAFAVKSSLGILFLLALAAAMSLTRKARPSLFEWFFLGASAYVYISAMGASYNIGFRHMLPATPLLVVTAVLLVFRALPRFPAAVLLASLAFVQALETLAIHPHQFSFFNALAGGPERGDYWLNDSNLDWGQDVYRLALALPALGIREKDLTVSYFGGALPEAYLPDSRVLNLGSWDVPPGTYAVSSFILNVAPEFMAFRGRYEAARSFFVLRRRIRERGEPIGRVGYSIRIYRVR